MTEFDIHTVSQVVNENYLNYLALHQISSIHPFTTYNYFPNCKSITLVLTLILSEISQTGITIFSSPLTMER